MTSDELRTRFLKFFEQQGHKIIPSAPLVPENDPTTLFISAGMQPLTPYLMGQDHPEGKRLASIQKCIRTADLDEVGDNFHHTFFEMLGNWSLGDYFKEDSIRWSYQFLTSELGINPDRITISVFAGDQDAPRDEEAARIWQQVGIPNNKIKYLGKEDNWWAAGSTGPCGPDTEIFVDNVEVWNNVFMVYNRNSDGGLEELPKKNVDTGMGLERALAVLNGVDDNYQTDLWSPIITNIEAVSGKKYADDPKLFRRIADHTRASVFTIADGVEPSNTARGYVLRRLIRRALRYLFRLGAKTQDLTKIASVIISHYSSTYPELSNKSAIIEQMITYEQEKFQQPINDLELYRQDLEAAIQHHLIKKIGSGRIPILNDQGLASGKYVFENYQSFGVPPDLAREIIEELGLKFDRAEFNIALQEHQQKSRTASSGMFRGGLSSTSETETKYHTATHLLHAALRQILGTHVAQKGSNITPERLRFDFSHPQKLTEAQIKRVEDLVNQKIRENLPVIAQTMPKEEAVNSGALGFFLEKYGQTVTVYSINGFSKEICGGPHVQSTGVIEGIKITKANTIGSGLQRIYASLA